MYLYIKRGIKLTVIFNILIMYCYQLHTKFCPIFLPQD
jgi:hypothetical protein